MARAISPTTTDLRAAFQRAWALHLAGWTFPRAMAAPLVRWSLEKSAIAHRATLERRAGQPLPQQTPLI